jgi:outer membrane lipoprotein SlyB
MKLLRSITLAVCVLLLASTASFAQNTTTASSPQNAPANVCTTCGVVASIRYVEKKGEASGVGLVAGGVLGGVLGHQIGSCHGNTVATIAGVGVGAVAGNAVEKNAKKTYYYEVSVRLDNGKMRTLTQSAQPAFRNGDRVKIVSGNRIALLAN